MFIYVAVFGQYVYVDRLTSPIWLVVQPENSSAMAEIARTLKALKISIHNLMNYYENIKISKQPRLTKRFMMVGMEEVQDAVFLTEYLSQHPNERTKVLTKYTNALNKLHESGFCHGDFKPNNILVQNTGEVYVIDFHWDRKSNEACYPLFMNLDILWPPLAADVCDEGLFQTSGDVLQH